MCVLESFIVRVGGSSVDDDKYQWYNVPDMGGMAAIDHTARATILLQSIGVPIPPSPAVRLSAVCPGSFAMLAQADSVSGDVLALPAALAYECLGVASAGPSFASPDNQVTGWVYGSTA